VLVSRLALLFFSAKYATQYLRNLIMPAFSPEAIERLTPRMVDVVSRYLEAWADAAGPVLAEQQLKALTFDFIYAVSCPLKYDYHAYTR
jgi:cytochrome P450